MAIEIAEMRVHPARDVRVERLLDDVGVKWTFIQAYRLDAIDKRKSLGNQSRLISLQDETVELYAEAYRRGEEFPAIVVCAQSGSSLTVSPDGNHRISAAERAGLKHVPAYVTSEPSKLQFLSLTYRLNVEARHGLQITMNDRLSHAAHLVSVAGLTKQAAADVMGIPERRLGEFINIREAEARLRGLGAPVPKRSNDLRRLASVKSDVPLAALARVASAIPTTAFGDLVTKVNKARSDQEAVSVIQSTVALEKQQRAGLPVSPKTQSAYYILNQVCNRISKLPSKEQVESMPTDLKPVIRSRLDDRATALMEIADWLRTAD